MDREKSELLDVLFSMVEHYCLEQGAMGIFFSQGVEVNARAMRLLAKHGKLKILKEEGNRILAEEK